MVKEVDVDVKYKDPDGDTLTTTQEYSVGGPFLAMTLLTGDGAHTLPIGGDVDATVAGVDFNHVWDARTDAGQGFAGNATVRTILDDTVATPVNVDQVVALVNNSLPSGCIDSIIQRQVDSNLTDILFSGTDAESDTLAMTFDFSTVGAGGPFSTMTLATGDGAHTLTLPFPASPGGTQQNIVWDAKTDLAVGFDGMVWFKFTIDDGVSGPLDINNNQIIISNTAPVISSLTLTLRP